MPRHRTRRPQRRAATTVLAVVAGLLTVGAAADARPDDPLYAAQYGPPQIRAEAAWQRSTGAGAVVAVIDTGIDLDHPDLMGNTIPGIAFLGCGDDGCGNGDWQSPPSDPVGHPHGTHVAGTVAALTGNGVGVAGVAPDAEVLAVRVLNDAGSGTSRDVGRGIRWAADHGAHVINMSLGDDPGSQVLGTTDAEEQYLRESVAYANERGVVVVASAGNDFASVCGTPSWYDGALCVAATTREEAPSEFSNFAVKPDLLTVAAPGGTIRDVFGLECGEQIVSTVPPGTGDPFTAESCGYPADLAYDEYSGTSMAAPHVAGAAALLTSMGCTRTQTIELLTTTARQPGTDVRGVWDPSYGYGIVDAGEATARAADLCTPDPAAPQRPVAADDAATARLGQETVVDVLANDHDPDGGALRVLSAGGARGGTVEVRDGLVVYRPGPDAGPTDAFRYSVVDADGQVAAATVHITAVEGEATFTETVVPTTLHFQGNLDEGCSGDGRLDLIACGGPWLRPDAALDGGPAARWTLGTLLTGANPNTIYDPNWTWQLPAPTTIRGDVEVAWWASCAGCVALGSGDWVVRLFADGQPVLEEVVTVAQATSPARLEATLPLPGDVTARSAFVLHIEPFFVDQQPEVVLMYDSALPCPGAAAGPCDGTLDVDVVARNAAPLAWDDTATTRRNQPVAVDVLANDGDPDGDAVTLTGFVQPANGTVREEAGRLVYEPRPGHGGTDTFSYTIADPAGATDTATVTVTTEPAGGRPPRTR